MDVRHLDLFRELADRGTITAVAQATYRTPSAVSQQLRSAERAFGVRLVEPDGRRLRLTTAGRLLAEGAVEVATALARVRAGVDELTGDPSGTVTIAGLPSALEFLAPGLATRFAGSWVELRLDDADVGEREFDSLAADYDLVIGHTLDDEVASTTNLVRRIIVREPLDVAVPASHRLAGRSHLRASDLAGERWIGVPAGYPFDTVRIAIENRAGQGLEIVQRLRDNRLVEALVGAGQACALLPRFTTRSRNGFVLLPLTDVRSTRSIVVLGRADRLQRAAVRAVLEALPAEGGRQAIQAGVEHLGGVGDE